MRTKKNRGGKNKACLKFNRKPKGSELKRLRKIINKALENQSEKVLVLRADKLSYI